AARRSVLRRRVSTLEYPEASEEVGFKGTMTLVGCATLWLCLLLLIVSYWFPWIGWVIVPVLVFFLGLQLLRWFVPKSPQQRSVTVRRKGPNKHSLLGWRSSPTLGPARACVCQTMPNVVNKRSIGPSCASDSSAEC